MTTTFTEPAADKYAWLDHEAQCLEHFGFPRRQLQAIVAIGRSTNAWPTYPIKGHGTDPTLTLAHELLRGRFIVLLGDYGRGKTTLATVIAWRALQILGTKQQPYRIPASRARFYAMMDYIEDLRSRGFAGKSNQGKVIKEDTKDVPVLVLDELQQIRGTEDDDMTIDRIMNERYEAKRGMILITNLKPGPMQETLRARNISRLTEVGISIQCTWKNYRQEAGK